MAPAMLPDNISAPGVNPAQQNLLSKLYENTEIAQQQAAAPK